MRVRMIRVFRVVVCGRLYLFSGMAREMTDSIALWCGLAPGHRGWPILMRMAFAGFSFPQLRLVGHAISGNCDTSAVS